MKKPKVKFIPKHRVMKCWSCDGKGKINGKLCTACKGAKTFVEESYILRVGNQAFQVDGLK